MKSSTFETKAPFTRQEILCTARMKVVRVPKNSTDYSFTRPFVNRAKRCGIMI